MKKISILAFFLLISSFSFGQSVTILPNKTTSQSDSNGENINVITNSNSLGIFGRRFNGTFVSKTPIQNGDELFRVSSGGWWSPSGESQNAAIKFNASENWNLFGSGSQISFTTTSNGAVAQTERMVINHIGNVGIGIISPLEKLHVVGNIRSSNLTGSGVRNVYADANGTLIDAAQSRSVVISPMSFQRMNLNTAGTFSAWGIYGDCQMSVGATDRLIAPIILPVGAIITGVTFNYTDTSPTSNFKVNLMKTPTTTVINTSIATLFQNTVNANTYDISNISSGLLNEPVLANYYYFFTVVITDVAGTSFSSPWATYMSVKGINVNYTF